MLPLIKGGIVEVDFAEQLTGFAYVLQAVGENGMAFSHFESAFITFKRLLGSDHPRTAEAQKVLNECQTSLDDRSRHRREKNISA